MPAERVGQVAAASERLVGQAQRLRHQQAYRRIHGDAIDGQGHPAVYGARARHLRARERDPSRLPGC